MKSPSESGTSEPHGHSREAAPSASGAQEYLGLVVVDYLQLMSGRFEKRNQEMSTISRVFKLLSKELNVPMPVLSQLSAAPEMRQGDHRPQLSDLHESGSIEQDADLVAFIFREESYQRDREDLHGLAELLVSKQRPGGEVDLVFLHHLTKFEKRLRAWPRWRIESSCN